jgi:exodeoxyribonuclease-3
VRIATWNVNGLRARQDLLLRWLRLRQPDVLALQELKLEDAQFPHDAFAQAGYHAAVHGQKSWNGVALLARKPLATLQVGLPGQEAVGARLVAAEVEGVAVASVYCPNGKHVGHDDFPKKLAWLDALADWLAARRPADAPLVLGGDLNVCPGPLDTWNEAALRGQIFHTDAERARFRRLLDAGLRDLFREKHPEAKVFSWWDYRGGAFHKGEGLRIDFLLGTAPVLARVTEVSIDREWRKKQEGLTASDHAPVIAELA